jgi:hypothetical protein
MKKAMRLRLAGSCGRFAEALALGFLVLCVLAGVVMMSGCSVFRGDINPDSGMFVGRRALATEQDVPYVDYEIRVAGSWLDEDEASILIDDEFDGESEVLVKRTITYTRGTRSNANAGATVVGVAEEGGRLGAAITSAGTTVAVELIAAQLGIAVEEVAGAIERARIEAEGESGTSGTGETGGTDEADQGGTADGDSDPDGGAGEGDE